MTLALLPAPALGDGILAMPLAHTVHATGQPVIVYHDALCELRAWYPWARIEPAPAGGLGAAADADALFVGDPARVAAAADFEGATLCFGKEHWLRDQPYLESLEAAARPAFGLDAFDASPGVVPPRERESAGKRIALHPTSANAAKDWSPARWLALAARLQALQWEPSFVVAASEEATWRAHAGDAVPVAVPGDLDAVAGWLQDAAGLIATDSGIAHLGSAVGTPTVAVFRKASSARFWGPAWGRRGTVAPGWRLPGRGGHRFWRTFLRPARVVDAFDAVVMRA